MTNPIGWCDVTWNPVTGCTPVSPACDHCYARRMANRLAGRFGYPSDDPFRVVGHPDKLHGPRSPYAWRKPRRVFVVSMGDLFHEQVTEHDIAAVFRVMLDSACRHHTFMVLTKRATRMRDFVSACYPQLAECAPHIQLGVTAENQEWADKRIPDLLATPAAVRFASVEPSLSQVDLWQWLGGARNPIGESFGGRGLDWVICGGETGPAARPMYPTWVRQCVAAGVPVWFKGWGAHVPAGQQRGLLDGVEWHQRPEEIR